MAALVIDPNATALTVKLRLEVVPTDPPGKVNDCKLSYSLEDKDGKVVAEGSSHKTELGPVKLPPPPSAHKGDTLTTRFTCEGRPGTEVRFVVEVAGVTGAVEPFSRKIPDTWLLSWNVDHDLS